MKLTVIDLSRQVHGHLSWEKLAEISGMTVAEYQQAHRERFGNIGIDARHTRPPCHRVKIGSRPRTGSVHAQTHTVTTTTKGSGRKREEITPKQAKQ